MAAVAARPALGAAPLPTATALWNPQLLPPPPAPARPLPGDPPPLLAQSTPPFEPVLEVQAVQLATMPNTDEDGYDPQKEKKAKKDTGPPFNFTDGGRVVSCHV